MWFVWIEQKLDEKKNVWWWYADNDRDADELMDMKKEKQWFGYRVFRELNVWIEWKRVKFVNVNWNVNLMRDRIFKWRKDKWGD